MDVSIVITTYKRNGPLREAIESALNQSHKPAEVIVVDGSGNEYAEPVVKEYPQVKYLPQDHDRGVASARDDGVSACLSEYVHFLDDDDSLKKRAVEAKLNKARESEAGVVYSGLEWHNGHSVLPDDEVHGDVLQTALSFAMAPCIPSTMLIRGDILKEVIPTAELPNDDGAMKIELARRTEFEFIEEPLTLRGDSDNSLGGSEVLVKERFEMIDYYEELYDEKTRQEAMIRAHLLAASTKYNRQMWSGDSIRHLLSVNRLAQGIQLEYIAALVLSLFGRPGWEFGRSIQNKYLMGDSHQGTIDS
ncbi:glycosyltransferase family 2 protein [Halorubrum sp. AS12]|uniref:glycosyltransferase family 2 protein n=1 Tax=Halorubrum sp. AS12 TaxID=3409687 RepID=UPI003DA77FFA